MNNEFMNMAYEEAMKAYDNDEVPIGAVIVKHDKVISRAYNQKESLGCALGHAEIIAIYEASKKMKNWRLDDCDIYVTLEPCPMCASAIKQSRISNVYCSVKNSDSNNALLINKIFSPDNANPGVSIHYDLNFDRGSELLKKFFDKKRKK